MENPFIKQKIIHFIQDVVECTNKKALSDVLSLFPTTKQELYNIIDQDCYLKAFKIHFLKFWLFISFILFFCIVFVFFWKYIKRKLFKD